MAIRVILGVFIMNKGLTHLHQKGLTLWLTGMPCSGKTTLARAISRVLRNSGYLVVEVDGDVIRKNFCTDLSFSKKDRDVNVARTAFLANLLTENGIIAVVSSVSPYAEMRHRVRKKIDHFIEVYVRCPLSVCEARDVKGMYALARKGKIKNFTGVSDAYEEPVNPDLIVDTDRLDKSTCIARIMDHLRKNEWVLPENPFPGDKVLTSAFQLAAYHHRGQERKGGAPYLIHPVGVAKLLKQAGAENEIIAAGLLHDVLEDTGCEMEEMIKKVGQPITAIVLEVTEKDKTIPWRRRKLGYLNTLKRASRAALTVACADKIDNLQSLIRGLKSGKGFDKSFSAGMREKMSNYKNIYKVIRSKYPTCSLLSRFDEALAQFEEALHER